MEEVGSFDNDGDVTDVADRFSDEIIGYDVEDIVDISITDDATEAITESDNENNKIEDRESVRLVNGVGEASESNSRIRRNHSCTNFSDRRWTILIGLGLTAAFLTGILIGNTHQRSNAGRGHPPSTFGNPALGYGEPHPPPTFGNPALGYGGDPYHGSAIPPSDRWDGSNNHNSNNYGDIPQTNYHQGPPSTEEEHYEQRKRHFTTLAVQWSGAAAIATPKSPARRALDWMLDEDPFQFTTADRTLDIQQRYIMAVFYFATLGDHWSSRRRSSERKLQNVEKDLHDDSNSDSVANFFTSRDVCQWSTSDGKTGVFCDDSGTIHKLEFRDFGLGGTLPQEIAYLSNTDLINIEYNDVEGILPTQYGLLTNLQSMKFENNQITGKIPTELANLKKLEKLDLDGNYFTGFLPTELAGLESIVKIEIGGSRLRGSIPIELSGLKETLQKLDLKDNKFHGKIPTHLGSLTKLTYLDLENNKLTGTIPLELSGAISLEMLYLNGNDLGGNLDAVFCNTNMAFFEFVADCRGTAPEVECSCCTSCCDSRGFNCTGTIEPLTEEPVVFSTDTPTAQPSAQTFTQIPTAHPSINTSKLKQVLSSVSDMDALETQHTDQYKAFMWMARKDPFPLVLDTTPDSIIQQKYILVLLYVSTNGKGWNDQHSFLTEASVCDWKGVVCNTKEKIVSIILEKNNLDGTIVSELGHLGSSLKELQFSMNRLRGDIPSELGLLTGLTTLDIFDNNDITGTMPSELSTQYLPQIEKVQLVGTGIKGDLDPLFCTSNPFGDVARSISANCFGPSVICSCCNVCCDASGDNCQVMDLVN